MAADQSGWCLLKVGVAVAIFKNKTTMKFVASIDSSFHKLFFNSINSVLILSIHSRTSFKIRVNPPKSCHNFID